ncbi:MAG: putative F0F1-ATPase subunit Ca2+/Mg2+ transporter [Planctomycetota bacterium]|jgi:F0F1-type ATP synthase assembly protein I
MSLLPRASGSWDRGSDALGAALTFAVSVALFAWLGHLGDGSLGTSPILMIVGVLMGLVGGFLHVLRVLAPDLLPFGKSSGHPAERRGSAPRGKDGERPADPHSD